jgi:energy-converting hydrogenase A subunit M
MPDEPQSIADIPQYGFFRDLEAQLNLEADFFQSLLADDDWSFVIKLHALVEAAVTHLLTTALGDERLRAFIARIEMSNDSTGKMAILKRLDLVDADSRRFIKKLSELRNRFVHDVTNASTTLEDFFSSLETNELKGYEKAFRWGYRGDQTFTPKIEGEWVHVNELTKSFAVTAFPIMKKLSLWFGSGVVFQQVYHQAEKRRIDQDIHNIGRMLVDLVQSEIVPETETEPNQTNGH